MDSLNLKSEYMCMCICWFVYIYMHAHNPFWIHSVGGMQMWQNCKCAISTPVFGNDRCREEVT